MESEALEVTNGSERFDRIERILEQVARNQDHDEAFELHDAEMKVIREQISADAENIQALARIAELHHQPLEDLEGGEAT